MRKALLGAGILILPAVCVAYYIYVSWEDPQPVQKSDSGSVTITEDPIAASGFAPASDLPANDTTPTGPLKPVRTVPDWQKEYRNVHYRFSLFYPNGLNVKEYDEGNGAETISFESADAKTGFEIFVVPYGERQVSADRFKMDEPSGVIREPVDVIIDSVRGTMFFGKNGVMGDTREVWFIRSGYLFEVTTYKDLDPWLAGIMQTWQFL